MVRLFTKRESKANGLKTLWNASNLITQQIILEPTYAEMWLAKRSNVEPNDWLASYRTWKDQMELEWIDRQTYEN